MSYVDCQPVANAWRATGKLKLMPIYCLASIVASIIALLPAIVSYIFHIAVRLYIVIVWQIWQI